METEEICLSFSIFFLPTVLLPNTLKTSALKTAFLNWIG